MDEHLRDLERQAKTGDQNARRAVGQEFIRRGFGWHGELLPEGFAVHSEFPVYTFDTGRGFSIEMLYAPRLSLWIARRPTRWADERCGTSHDTGPPRGATQFGSADDDPVADREWRKASDYCEWIGCRLPVGSEIESARSTLRLDGLVVPDKFAEWCADGEDQRGLTPVRAYVARAGVTLAVPCMATNGRSPLIGFRCVFPPGRDIDCVIAKVRRTHPEVLCVRHPVSHPGVDDDGLWYFLLPKRYGTVRVESPWGTSPFDVWDENHELHGQTTEETAARIVEWLTSSERERS